MKLTELIKFICNNFYKLTPVAGGGRITTKTLLKEDGSTIYNDPIVVVDVGCRWGFAERFLSEEVRDKFRIFGFDPDHDECKLLQESYSHLPAGFVTCIPIGLANSNGRRTLYITKEPACSSMYRPIKYLSDNYPALDCIKITKKESIDVITLKKWAVDNNIKHVDYLKIDTQGSELEILKGAGDFLLTTRCIDVEVEFNPIYKDQALFGEVDSFLRSKGFELWRISNLVHYSFQGKSIPLPKPNTFHFDDKLRQVNQAYGGQLFWADAQYIRSDILDINKLAKNQKERDLVLLRTLNMHDVVEQIHLMSAKT